eukprot:7458893-Pyramimonas_sp.AAC.1
MAAAHSQYRGALRLPRSEAGGPSDLAVLAQAARPTVSAIIRDSSSRLFGQVLTHAPGPSWLYNAEYGASFESWLHTIRDDLTRLRATHHKF